MLKLYCSKRIASIRLLHLGTARPTHCPTCCHSGNLVPTQATCVARPKLETNAQQSDICVGVDLTLYEEAEGRWKADQSAAKTAANSGISRRAF
jgi:hypothetical protein